MLPSKATSLREFAEFSKKGGNSLELSTYFHENHTIRFSIQLKFQAAIFKNVEFCFFFFGTRKIVDKCLFVLFFCVCFFFQG